MTGVRVRTVLYARWERKKERKKEKLGLVREGEGFWGLDGWRVGGEVERWRGGGEVGGEVGGVVVVWLGGGEVGGVVVVVWGWCLRCGFVGSWLVRKERGNVGVG